jgi:hypothetical protein
MTTARLPSDVGMTPFQRLSRSHDCQMLNRETGRRQVAGHSRRTPNACAQHAREQAD